VCEDDCRHQPGAGSFVFARQATDKLIHCLGVQSGKILGTIELRRRGFSSIVDARSVLPALTSQGELPVFEPSDRECKKLTGYKVAETETYAYPVPAGKGLFVKDKDAVSSRAVD
jgi:hypothetical protein